MNTHSVLSIDIGVSNFAICALELPTVVVRSMECWNLGNTKAVPTSAIVDRLLEIFNTTCKCFQMGWVPDIVLIEQQVRGAHVNLALGFSTYAYMKTRFPDATVKFVPPSAKFTGYANFIDITDDTIIQKLQDKASFSTYTKRKRLAIEISEVLLRQMHQPSLQTLCPGIKQDDLADAFLQAFCI